MVPFFILPMENNIFLVGPMGAGKSTIGKRLAKSLKKDFIDSDHVIEERTGVDIPTIFDIEGEEGFRTREESTLEALTSKHNVILATGGGAVIRLANRQHLMSRGIVIYLKTSVSQQLARTRHDRNRPLLQTEDPAAKLAELMEIREPLYIDMADIIVDTDFRHSNQVVKEIQKKLQEYAE